MLQAPYVLDIKLTAEQMDPQIPVRFDPQIPLADGDDDRRLRDGVGAEVVQLYSVVFAQRPHESADGYAKSSLVELHEAHDVAVGGIRLGLLRPRGESTPDAPS